MTYCLTFAVRNRPTPLHFCYGSEDEARTNLEEFSRNIYVASDDELVLVNNSAGFLKRSFVSVELDGFSDGEDDDVNASPDGPQPAKRKKQKRASGRANRRKNIKRLEADLEQIVSSLE